MEKYKFRLWDSEHNKFLEDDLDTEYFINTYGTVYKITEYNFGRYNSEISVSSLDNIEISQYTGQLDEYKNKIYEGDIIIDCSEDGDYYLKLIGFGDDEREYTSIVKGFKVMKDISLDFYYDESEKVCKGKHSYLIEEYNIKIDNDFFENWIGYQVIGNKYENEKLYNLIMNGE
jgi:yopX protein